MKKNNAIIGVVLLAVGGMALLNNLGITDFNLSIWRFWPLVFIIPGLAFELNYFNGNAPVGVLVPGGIFLTYGGLFLFCSFFGYGHMAYLWPLFLGGVGVGLFQLYYFGNREKPIFWVSFGFLSFSLVSIFFGLLSLKGSFVLPVILIGVGAMMLFNHKEHDKPIVTFEFDRDEEEDL